MFFNKFVFISLFEPPSKRFKFFYQVPEWEKEHPFYPLSIRPNFVSRVHFDGSIVGADDQVLLPFNAHLSSDRVNKVLLGQAASDVKALAFPNPSNFLAGQLHEHLEEWIRIANLCSYPLAQTVLDWLENKVQVDSYFRHFKGKFKGEQFDSPSPPPRVFMNHSSCKPFSKFITDTILQRLASGAISVWGKVGEVSPPHLVMPLTVEPSKPRLCAQR